MTLLWFKSKFLSVLILVNLGFAAAADRFEGAAAVLQPRTGHTATLLPDGRVLFEGGFAKCSGCLRESEVYDPSTGLIEKVGGPRPSRRHHSATLMADGRVLIAGGDIGEENSKTAEIFDPASGKFLLVGEMSRGRSRHTALLLKDGRVLVVDSRSSIEVFDPVTQSFRVIEVFGGSAPYSRGLMISDDRIFYADEGSAGTFTLDGRIAQLLSYRLSWILDSHSMILLPDQSVLIAGGLEFIEGPFYFSPMILTNTKSTALVDLSSRISGNGPKMLSGRSAHSATVLMDGRVLIAGGDGRNDRTPSSSEFFDSGIRRFISGPSLAFQRNGHSATFLRDGRVLIAGGVEGEVVSDAEFFVPDVLPATLQVLSQDGQAAVLHAGTGRFVGAGDRAATGDVVEVYARGISSGLIAPRVSIGGKMAEVLYFGTAPGLDGVQQINVRIPEKCAPGADVPLWILDQERPSQVVKIGVRE